MKGRRHALRALCAGALGCAGQAGADAWSAPADTAPFEWPALELLDGTVWTPGSWRGQAAVLVVWATWCGFCQRHNAHVETLYRAIAGRPLRVLGMALDSDPGLLRRHVRARGYTFPVTPHVKGLRTRLALKSVTPLTVTFDRQSRPIQRIPGEMFEADVLALARLADGTA